MKKNLFLLFILTLVFPLSVLAEEKVSIVCDKTEAKRNDEISCQIIAKDLEFILTSVTGKVKLDENLQLVSSTYDNTVFKILDENFSVENINLISEDVKENPNITIATFKVKAVNKVTIASKISFEEVLFGDEKYENHEMKVEPVNLYLENITVSNPSTDLNNPVMICCIVLAGAGIIYCFLKKKRYI